MMQPYSDDLDPQNQRAGVGFWTNEECKEEIASRGADMVSQHHDDREQFSSAMLEQQLASRPDANQEDHISTYDTPNYEPISSGRCKKMLYFVCFTAFVISLLASLVARSLKHADKDNISKAPSREQARYNSLLTQVLEFNVTAKTALEDKDSASFKALHWLAFDDVETVHEDNIRTRFALATLFFSTNGNESAWISSQRWLSPHSVCFWHGIDCIGDDEGEVGLVEGIHLGANKLAGTIPKELSLLQDDCKWLDLSHNDIEGTIPDEIGRRMVNLHKVFLGPNKLQHKIPESLFHLSHLTHLYVDDCQISGTIPKAIGRATSLHGLGLNDNDFQGPIPSSIGQLTKLRVLNLDTNSLTGSIPSSLGNLVGLVDLRLQDNRLVGPIPSELSNLRMLEVFYLYENELTGPLDALNFTDMALLGDVQLQTNHLNGTIPESLGLSVLLQVLYLDQNALTGYIPSTLGNNHLLDSLYLFDNELSGSIPSAIGNLKSLKTFYANENRLSGSITSALGNLVNLERLFLNNNTFHGRVPTQIGQLGKLKEAHFHGNDITGVIPLCDNAPYMKDLTADCERNNVKCSCCTVCYG